MVAVVGRNRMGSMGGICRNRSKMAFRIGDETCGKSPMGD